MARYLLGGHRIKALASVLLALLAAGCAGKREVIRTVEVKVPVVTQAVPPAALQACGNVKPTFRFKSLPGTNHVVILEEDQQAFMDWVNEKQRCIESWKEWGRE